MAEEKPSLHVDLDWKKQAQEEKRRLEEEQKKRAEAAAAAAAAPSPAAVVAPTGEPSFAPSPASSATAGTRRGRELPVASIQSLTKSLLTQIAMYLQQVTGRNAEDTAAMDVAKHLIDTLGVLEQKTANNLTPEESQFLDTALYDARTRFIGVAEQVIAGA